MTDEYADQLFASLIYLADTLITGFDVIDLADRLMTTCQDLLGAEAAGITLESPQGELYVLASTSEEMRLLELIEIAHSGPCLSAFQTGEIVRADDLKIDGEQWPEFATKALEEGYRSAYAFPMRLRDHIIGALNLFSRAPAALSERDQQVAQVLASMATIGLINHRAIRRQELLAEQLQSALDSRIAIEQAKGVIAEYAGVDMIAAFNLLRTAARSWRRPLGEVAAAIARGEIPRDRVIEASSSVDRPTE